jgi:hypothetical protein
MTYLIVQCGTGGPSATPIKLVDQKLVFHQSLSDEIRLSCVLPHFEVTTFLGAAIGLLGLISLCLLVFGRLGVGSIVAFLAAGIVIGQVQDIPAQTIRSRN